MIPPEKANAALSGLTVKDAIVVFQMIQRLCRSGIIDERELLPLGVLRTNLARSVFQATGIDYDNPSEHPPLAETPKSKD